MRTDLATLDGFHVLRRLIAVIALTAVAVAGLASPAHAACRPTIRQVWIRVAYSGYTITTVRAKIARTDHRAPKGVRVCLRMRDINSMEHAELGMQTREQARCGDLQPRRPDHPRLAVPDLQLREQASSCLHRGMVVSQQGPLTGRGVPRDNRA